MPVVGLGIYPSKHKGCYSVGTLVNCTNDLADLMRGKFGCEPVKTPNMGGGLVLVLLHHCLCLRLISG